MNSARRADDPPELIMFKRFLNPTPLHRMYHAYYPPVFIRTHVIASVQLGSKRAPPDQASTSPSQTVRKGQSAVDSLP